MKPARPLDRFPVFRARSVDEMRAVFAQVYGLSMFVESTAREVDVAANCYPMKDIILGYSKYSAHMGLVFPDTVDTFHIVPVRGRGEAAVNGDVVPLRAGHGVTVPRATEFTERFATDYEHIVLTMNTRKLTDKLAALAGTSIDRPLTFSPAGDDQSPRAKAFRDHLFFLVGQLSTSTVPFPRLVQAEFEQTLMVMLLCASRHSFSHLLDRAPADASVGQIRRAEDYVEANWQQPITLEALAAVTGMSAFELFRAFKNSPAIHRWSSRAGCAPPPSLPPAASAISTASPAIMFGRSQSIRRRHSVKANPAVLQVRGDRPLLRRDEFNPDLVIQLPNDAAAMTRVARFRQQQREFIGHELDTPPGEPGAILRYIDQRALLQRRSIAGINPRRRICALSRRATRLGGHGTHDSRLMSARAIFHAEAGAD
jgi:hypothetical protein